MPFQPVPDTAEAVIQWNFNGQLCINTLYYKFEGGYESADIDNLASAVDLIVGADWLDIVSNAIAYVNTHVRGLSDEFDFQADDSDSAGVGAVTGGSQSNNVALAVARRSGLTGRGSRGRIFIGGIADSKLSAPNTVSTTFVDEIVAVLQNIDNAASAIGWTPVIVHRSAGGVLLNPAQTLPLTTWLVTDRTVDSQRRRLPGRGV